MEFFKEMDRESRLKVLEILNEWWVEEKVPREAKKAVIAPYVYTGILLCIDYSKEEIFT